MLRTQHTADASDLLVDGTYALRRGLAQLVRRPALRLERATGERTGHDDRPDRTSPPAPAPGSRAGAHQGS